MTEPLDYHLMADALAGKVLDGKRPEKSMVAELASRKVAEASLREVEFDALGALPSGTALLRLVAAEQHDSFHMTFCYDGVCDSAPAEESVSLRKHLLTIPGIVRKVANAPQDRGSGQHVPWRESYLELATMWKCNDHLIRWINRLFTSGASRPRLIVKDGTGLGIPWELYFKRPVFTGPNVSPERGWLGALIPVVRWINLSDGGLANRGRAEKKDCVAGLLMLEDEDLGRLDDRFDHLLVEPRTKDMWTLLRWLERRHEPFGLVMIRCHGSEPDAQGRQALCEISYNEYDHKDYPALAYNGALVFLNACFGAASNGDPSQQPAHFSELFLRKGASGVIAATSDIDIVHAQELAEDLLTEAITNPLNIANWLRRWRCEYAEKAEQAVELSPQHDQENAFKRFFEAFKYVYFGHLDSTLHAIPAHPNGQVAL
jgi:hypothetical protein